MDTYNKKTLFISVAFAVGAIILILVFVGISIRADTGQPVPYIRNTALLAIKGGNLHVSGDNLFTTGVAQDRYFIRFSRGFKNITVYANDSSVVSWSQSEVVMKLPDSVNSNYSAKIGIVGGAISNAVLVETYQYSSVPVPQPDPARPLDLAFTARSGGNIWMIPEFHSKIFYMPANSTTMTPYTVPLPSKTIFQTQLWGGDGGTNISTLGEDVDMDSGGNIWFTQGGWYMYTGAYPERNRSRVVRLNPITNQWTCFNIPINDAEAIDFLFDESRGEAWVAVAGSPANAVLRFRPSTFLSDDTRCDFDFTTPPPAKICLFGQQNRCFEKFSMPRPGIQPARLIKDNAGNIWFSEFFGTAIGMISQVTKQVFEYPLSPHSSDSPIADIAGSGPWSLAIDGNGFLWLTEFDAAVARNGTKDCAHLDAGNKNPCATEYVIPVDTTKEHAHTLAIDRNSNKWFSLQAEGKEEGAGRIGRLSYAGSFELFPPLSEFPGHILGGATGIIVNNNATKICFSEYEHQSVGCLNKY